MGNFAARAVGNGADASGGEGQLERVCSQCTGGSVCGTYRRVGAGNGAIRLGRHLLRDGVHRGHVRGEDCRCGYYLL